MLMSNCVFLLIFQLSLYSSTVVFKTTKIECKTNPKFLQNVTCRLKPLNRYMSGINMECDILQPIRNFSLHMTVQKKNDANVYKPFFFDGTANVCSMLSRKIFPAISTIALKVMKRFTNINHTCPYTGHLIGKDLYLDERLMPVIAPIGEYRIITEYLEGYPYEFIGSLILNLEAIEMRDGKRNYKRRKI